MTVTLSIATDRVVAGGQIPATLTIANHASRSLFSPSCPSNGTFSVGLSSSRIPFSPANGLVLCGTQIPAHRSLVQHEEISTRYQGCGGPPQPYCLPGRNPIPPLPAGRYATAVEWQQVPAAIPQPGSIPVTVLAQNPRAALLAQQQQWPRRIKLGYLGSYWGPSRPGRIVPNAEWRRTDAGTTCAGSTCWSLTLVGDQVFVLRMPTGGGPWRVASPVVMGDSLSSWYRARSDHSLPVLQLLGPRSIFVLTPSQLYVSADAGASWYVGSQLGSVVSVTAGPGTTGPVARFELTAAAAEGSNAVRVYRSVDGVRWAVAPSRTLPDLEGMRPGGVELLLSSLQLRGRIHPFAYCGGPPRLRTWPYGTIWFQTPAAYATVSRGTLVTVDVARHTQCVRQAPREGLERGVAALRPR